MGYGGGTGMELSISSSTPTPTHGEVQREPSPYPHHHYQDSWWPNQPSSEYRVGLRSHTSGALEKYSISGAKVFSSEVRGRLGRVRHRGHVVIKLWERMKGSSRSGSS